MIPFVRDMAFEYGRPDRISPLVRRLIADNPGPFTFRGTGTYIVGRGEVAVIDPGPDLPEHLDAILRATQGETITAIAVTHTHLDHSPLSAALARATGATIHGLPAPHAAEASIRLDEGHDHSFTPDVLTHDGGRIAGPGWTLEAVATEPWLGLKDDLAVRVRPTAQGSRVDFRSISRFGQSDIGDNCDRVTRLVQAVR